MHIPLVQVYVILNLQKRCTSLWFMYTSFWTYRRDAHPFFFMWMSFWTDRREAHPFGWCERHSELTEDVHPFGSCERHSERTEEMHIPLVHVYVILNLQKRYTSLWDRYQRKTFLVVDISINRIFCFPSAHYVHSLFRPLSHFRR